MPQSPRQPQTSSGLRTLVNGLLGTLHSAQAVPETLGTKAADAARWLRAQADPFVDAASAYGRYETTRAKQLADALASGASTVGQFGGRVLDDMRQLTPQSAANALDRFSSGLTGGEAQLFPEYNNSPLSNLAMGAGLGLGIVADPSPAGEINVAKKLAKGTVTAETLAQKLATVDPALGATLGTAKVAAAADAMTDALAHTEAASPTRWTRRVANVLKSELPAKEYKKFVAQTTPKARKYAEWLHPSEARLLTAPSASKQFERIREDMPSAKAMAGPIAGGAEKQGWYKNSREALSNAFGQDADMFAGVLAATSPQNPVEMNLQNALNIYGNWVKSGRPTERQAIIDIMGRSVVGEKGADSVLPAWINNTVDALQGGNMLSGPKVDNFWANLRSRARQTPMGEIRPEDAVTLDAWMANLFGMKQSHFAGTKAKGATNNPGYKPGYLAGMSVMREAADLAGVTPAEAQEMAWSFGKALLEKSESLGIPARSVIDKGLLTAADIAGTPDFATLLKSPQYAPALENIPGALERALKMPSNAARPAMAPNKEQLRFMRQAADTLDELSNIRTIASNYKVGFTPPGRVVASAPMEAAPGVSTRVDPGFFAKTPGAQDRAASERLKAAQNLQGQNVLLEAMFPGESARALPGRGVYLNSEGTLESNKLSTAPVSIRTAGRGTKLNPADENALRYAQLLQSAGLGQEASVYSALSFANGIAPDAINAMRVVTPNTLPDTGLRTLAKKLDTDRFALQHRSNGVDILKFDGTPISPQEHTALQQMVVNELPIDKESGSPTVLTGRNIVNPDSSYTQMPFGEEGSRDVTRLLTGDSYDRLSKTQQANLDSPPVRRWASDIYALLAKNPEARRDHLNMLSIISESGVSGLAKALKDPSQVLPVLATLGLSASVLESVLSSETRGRSNREM